jgi:hypothetical protein
MRRAQVDFEAIRDHIEAIISGQRSGMDATPSSPSAVDVADQLRKLASLRAEGILSEDEFQAKKKQLLDL